MASDSSTTASRRGRALRVVLCSLVVVIATVGTGSLHPIGARASGVNVSFNRVIGGPGHAEIYAWGAATMPDGSVLISDYENARVVHYDVNGNLLDTPIGPGTLAQPHLSPYGLAVDPNDLSIYMGDVDGGAFVDKYTKDGSGVYQQVCRIGGAPLMNYPGYVAVESDGTLVIADARNNKLFLYTSTCTLIKTFATKGARNGQVNTPRGIAVDAANNIYVGDVNNNRIEVFDHSGTYIKQWAVAGGGFRGVAVDRQNNWVYVVQQGISKIDKFDLNGTLLIQWGMGTSNFPAGAGFYVDGGRDITVDGNHNVWVADMPDFRTQRYDSNGTLLTVNPEVPARTDPAWLPPLGGFNQPAGVDEDAQGNTFVVDTFNWRVEKFTSVDAPVAQWGHRGAGTYGYNYPRGIAVDRVDGSVYVADGDGVQIDKYDNAGTFLCGYHGAKPWAMTVGPNQSLYVADTDLNRIRVVNPNCTLALTFAGGQGSGNGQVLGPRGIAVDPVDGSLWISDTRNSRVQHLTATGGYLGQFSTLGPDTVTTPWGIVADSTHVFVADWSSSTIKVWDKAGGFAGAFSQHGSRPGQLAHPSGMTMGPDGKLYVSEQGTERVSVFNVA